MNILIWRSITEGRSLRGDGSSYSEQSCLWSSCGDRELLAQPSPCPGITHRVNEPTFGTTRAAGIPHTQLLPWTEPERLWHPRRAHPWEQPRAMQMWTACPPRATFMGSPPQKAGSPGPTAGLGDKLKDWSWSCVAGGV